MRMGPKSIVRPMSHPHLRFCRTSLTRDLRRVKVAQNRTALYSENESRDCATRHDATCDTACHTCELDARPLVARLYRRCDIGLRISKRLAATGNSCWGYRFYKNSSGDEIANVNFQAVSPESTRIR